MNAIDRAKQYLAQLDSRSAEANDGAANAGTEKFPCSQSFYAGERSAYNLAAAMMEDLISILKEEGGAA